LGVRKANEKKVNANYYGNNFEKATLKVEEGTYEIVEKASTVISNPRNFCFSGWVNLQKPISARGARG